MEILDIIVSAFVLIFSLGLFAVSITSFKKYYNQKLLLLCFVFFVFFMKGILLTLGLFTKEVTLFLSSTYLGLFDLCILILLFIATLKR